MLLHLVVLFLCKLMTLTLLFFLMLVLSWSFHPVLKEVCSEGHTGYVALLGCQQYVYCSAGTEMTTFDCAPGTLFTGQTCTWADQVDCQATQRPSRSPVTAPTYAPTVSPTEFPTELDIYNQVRGIRCWRLHYQALGCV